METEEKIKLARCPSCSSNFYIKTKEINEHKMICPICKKEVGMELKEKERTNGHLEHKSQSSPDKD